MLVSLNLLCRWLIQLSPLAGVTGISLFPPVWPDNCETSAKITTRSLIDMIEEFFILSLAGAQAESASAPTPSLLYLLRVKSAFASPDTETGLDWFFVPSCQAVTV